MGYLRLNSVGEEATMLAVDTLGDTRRLVRRLREQSEAPDSVLDECVREA